MGDLGLNPETALKLIQMVLRGAAYFLGGFAVLAISTYAAFLCLQIFSSPGRAKVRIAKVVQPVSRAPEAEQKRDRIPVELLHLAEDATVSGRETLYEG